MGISTGKFVIDYPIVNVLFFKPFGRQNFSNLDNRAFKKFFLDFLFLCFVKLFENVTKQVDNVWIEEDLCMQ